MIEAMRAACTPGQLIYVYMKTGFIKLERSEPKVYDAAIANGEI
jgi:hypothetical protein